MHAALFCDARIPQGAPAHAAARGAVAMFLVDERDRDTPLVSIPRVEVDLVVRFGPHAAGGVDAHALGARQRVRRKIIRAGQRAVTARLRLGAQQAVLGAPASELAGRIVALEDLWGGPATRRLYERLAGARDTSHAAELLEGAIAERLVTHDRAVPGLASSAAERLLTATVGVVARDLGVSERHLRRVFRDAVGVSPKSFARLARFQRALRAAEDDRSASWASIAAATGYYDQAHLIGEFRALTGATPRALVAELRGSHRVAGA